MFQSIVVAHDGTDCSDRAFDYAIALAKVSGAKLTVCHATDISSALSVVSVPGANPGPLCDALYKEAHSIAQHVNDYAAKAGVSVVFHDLGRSPAQGIIDAAESAGADLVVVGTHSRHGLENFLAPSVSQHVARDIQVPLLIVPTGSPALLTREN